MFALFFCIAARKIKQKLYKFYWAEPKSGTQIYRKQYVPEEKEQKLDSHIGGKNDTEEFYKTIPRGRLHFD